MNNNNKNLVSRLAKEGFKSSKGRKNAVSHLCEEAFDATDGPSELFNLLLEKSSNEKNKKWLTSEEVAEFLKVEALNSLTWDQLVVIEKARNPDQEALAVLNKESVSLLVEKINGKVSEVLANIKPNENQNVQQEQEKRSKEILAICETATPYLLLDNQARLFKKVIEDLDKDRAGRAVDSILRENKNIHPELKRSLCQYLIWLGDMSTFLYVLVGGDQNCEVLKENLESCLKNSKFSGSSAEKIADTDWVKKLSKEAIDTLVDLLLENSKYKGMAKMITREVPNLDDKKREEILQGLLEGGKGSVSFVHWILLFSKKQGCKLEESYERELLNHLKRHGTRHQKEEFGLLGSWDKTMLAVGFD